MNAPPFEVADIVRAAGKKFIEKNRSRLTWQHVRVLRAIERCRSAALVAIWISALAVASRPSPTTRVETAIAESARPMLVTGGSQIAKRNF